MPAPRRRERYVVNSACGASGACPCGWGDPLGVLRERGGQKETGLGNREAECPARRRLLLGP
eukprot:5090843-Alexandrium_andersonii.AAC.1